MTGTPDPSNTGAGIGQAAKELLQEMQKAQAEVQQKTPGGPNEAFQSAMQQTAQVTQAQAAQQAIAADKATAVLLQAKSDATLPSTRVGAAEQAKESQLTQLMSNLLTGQDRMNEIMQMALSGRSFSPPELIALQAGVYRFTQELELTSKVVEKATGGIKQTMNTQV